VLVITSAIAILELNLINRKRMNNGMQINGNDFPITNYEITVRESDIFKLLLKISVNKINFDC